MIFPLPQLQIMGAVQLIGSAADACGVDFLQPLREILVDGRFGDAELFGGICPS